MKAEIGVGSRYFGLVVVGSRLAASGDRRMGLQRSVGHSRKDSASSVVLSAAAVSDTVVQSQSAGAVCHYRIGRIDRILGAVVQIPSAEAALAGQSRSAEAAIAADRIGAD